MSRDPSQRRPDRLPLHLRIESEPLDEPEKQSGMESEDFEDCDDGDFDDGDQIILDPTDTEWDGDW